MEQKLQVPIESAQRREFDAKEQAFVRAGTFQRLRGQYFHLPELPEKYRGAQENK